MSPELLPDPADAPEPSRPSLDPSEEEALFQHLRRYKAQNGRRRRGRTLAAAGTVVAGAALLIVVVSVARWPRDASPVPEAAPPIAVLATTSAEPQAPWPAPRAPERTPRVEAPAEVPAERTPSPPDAPAAPPPARAEPPAARDDTTPATGETVASVPPVPPPAPAPSPAATVTYPPRARLATVSPGDTKERVFDRFATTFEERDGSVVRIAGMRWRASGRSSRHAHVDVAEVVLADGDAAALYWFVFGDDRLVAWGRSEEWPAAARRHDLETAYQPAAARSRRAP